MPSCQIFENIPRKLKPFNENKAEEHRNEMLAKLATAGHEVLVGKLETEPALKEFLGILGPEDDIARFEYMKKSARNFGSVLIGIETRKPENFMRLFAHLDEAGFTYTDITEDETLAQFVI